MNPNNPYSNPNASGNSTCPRKASILTSHRSPVILPDFQLSIFNFQFSILTFIFSLFTSILLLSSCKKEYNIENQSKNPLFYGQEFGNTVYRNFITYTYQKSNGNLLLFSYESQTADLQKVLGGYSIAGTPVGCRASELDVSGKVVKQTLLDTGFAFLLEGSDKGFLSVYHNYNKISGEYHLKIVRSSASFHPQKITYWSIPPNDSFNTSQSFGFFPDQNGGYYILVKGNPKIDVNNEAYIVHYNVNDSIDQYFRNYYFAYYRPLIDENKENWGSGQYQAGIFRVGKIDMEALKTGQFTFTTYHDVSTSLQGFPYPSSGRYTFRFNRDKYLYYLQFVKDPNNPASFIKEFQFSRIELASGNLLESHIPLNIHNPGNINNLDVQLPEPLVVDEYIYFPFDYFGVCYLLKLDLQGNLIWKKTIGEQWRNNQGCRFFKMNNELWLIGQATKANSNIAGKYLLRFDFDGNLIMP